MYEDRTTSGVLLGIILVLVIGILAWLAFTRGFFSGSAAPADNNGTLEVEINENLNDGAGGTGTGTGGGTGGGTTY